MATATIEQDRNEVRNLLQQAEERVRTDPDAEASNALTRAAVAIADRWAVEGRLAELLSPLLSEPEHRWVRYSAASILLHRGHAGLAVPVLETVRVPEARFLLRKWRREHGDGDSEASDRAHRQD